MEDMNYNDQSLGSSIPNLEVNITAGKYASLDFFISSRVQNNASRFCSLRDFKLDQVVDLSSG